MNTVAVACWFRVGLPLLLVAVLAGCNSKPNGSASTKAYTEADLETDLADSVELQRIVAAKVADENLSPPMTTSIQKSKPDEAVANIEYGTEPTQKMVMTLKKSEGKWTIQQP